MRRPHGSGQARTDLDAGSSEMEAGMFISSKSNAVWRCMFCMFALVILAAIPFATRISAQDSAIKDRIYVVTHVDTLPGNAPASKLLQQYVSDTKKDKGAVRIELYVQVSRANHFSLVEVWENQQAYDAHVAAAHTRQFREQIQPMLGSPFDERLHQILE
jgi:quinol monooxygenase YgiN